MNAIKEGNVLFEEIQNGEVSSISLAQKALLENYASMLRTLYENSRLGQERPLEQEEDVIKELANLTDSFKLENVPSKKLPDRIVSMFAHGAGFDSLEAMETYMDQKIAESDAKNRERAKNGNFSIEIGDFVKGINSFEFFEDILQNGSVCKEFLGAEATSDGTPLDTDLSRVLRKQASVAETIDSTISSGYGNTFLVLKNDGRFNITRERGLKDKVSIEDDVVGIRNDKKIEVFETNSEGHYGIRTGFASSEIDYIVTKEYSPKMALEIAKNGFYIPVVDMERKTSIYSR